MQLWIQFCKHFIAIYISVCLEIQCCCCHWETILLHRCLFIYQHGLRGIWLKGTIVSPFTDGLVKKIKGQNYYDVIISFFKILHLLKKVVCTIRFTLCRRTINGNKNNNICELSLYFGMLSISVNDNRLLKLTKYMTCDHFARFGICCETKEYGSFHCQIAYFGDRI